MEADDSGDEGYDSATANTSYATSIASEIRKGRMEFGRTFASYGRHNYGLPIDSAEQDRNDLQHEKFYLCYGDKLHLAPISDPKKVLDIGTGNGTWAIEIADLNPSAEVLGVDIAAIAPGWVPPNCRFEILDVEEDWLLKMDWDFIHGREFLLSIRDWPALINRAYSHLKPGGYLELACTVAEVDSDDGTLPPDAAYREMSRIFFEISDAIGVDGRAPKKWKQQMLDRGFDDVHETQFKVPSNAWPKDPRAKKIGHLELTNFLEFTTAGFKKGYVGVLGKDPDYLEVMLTNVRKESVNRKCHSYVWFWNVYGRKPATAAEATAIT